MCKIFYKDFLKDVFAKCVKLFSTNKRFQWINLMVIMLKTNEIRFLYIQQAEMTDNPIEIPV